MVTGMLSPQKLASQSRALTAAMAHVLWQALAERRPADRVLAAYLRTQRQFGSRDRRLISEMTYAACRWWGWLATLAPEPFRDALETAAAPCPPTSIPAAAWQPFFLAVLLTEGLDYPDMLRFWTEACGLRNAGGAEGNGREPEARSQKSEARMGEDAAARAALALRLLQGGNSGGRLDPCGLIPAWAPERIACPRPLPELIAWLQKRPPLWIRLQRGDPAQTAVELTAAGLPPRPHAHLPQAWRLDNARVNLYTLPAYREGRIEVQDLASQCIGAVCAPRPGQRWWDACAGAGGKSLLLSQLMEGRGTVIASDIREYKLEDLRRRARRSGFSNITPRAWDGKPLAPRKANYDGVLADGPCSCSGTWRRNPAARWSLNAAELPELAALQLRILRSAASGVRSGGVLVYATCSFFELENGGVVREFLRAAPGFVLETFPHPLTGAATEGMLQIWPWDGDCDAMFVARFRRKAAG